LIKHRSPISGIDAMGDSYVATAGYDSQLILWNNITKHALTRVHHDHLVNHCRFSSCGKFLVSASSDYTARIWSVPTLQLIAIMPQHDDDVEMAVFNPSSTRVATASRDHCIRIFDLSGYMEHKLVGHTADVISVEWIRGGKELVSSSDDGTVRIWSSDTGKLLETIDLEGIETDTIVSDEVGTLYIGNDEGDIIIIRHEGKQKVHAHSSGIKRLVFEPRRRMILSASYDRTVKIWNLSFDNNLKLLYTINVPDIVWLRSAAFAGVTKLVFGTFGSCYASYDLEKMAWDLENVENTPGLNSVNVGNGDIYTIGDAGVAFRNKHPITRLGSLCNFLGVFRGHVVTGGQTGTLFNVFDGSVIYQHKSPLNCSTTFFRGGEEHLIVGTYTGEGLIFREGSIGNLEHVATLKLHDNAIKGLASNKEHIFSVCADCSAAFYSIDNLKCVRHISDAHKKIANGAACLPDNRFVSISRDRNLRLWTIDSCQVIPTPHDHSVKCVAVSNESNLIATGAYDGKIAIYDLNSNTWVKTERPTAFGISSIVFSDAAGEFLASSYDGQVYHVPTQQLFPPYTSNGKSLVTRINLFGENQ
jgi:WD40 repeat protein